MPDEPSLHDVLRGSLAHHADGLGEPVADIATVWNRLDRRRARRRGIAVVGSVALLAAGAGGILLVADPDGTRTSLDGTDGSAALSWACTGPLGSDGVYDYFETCEALPGLVTTTTPSVSIVGSTIAGSVPATTAFSPFVGGEAGVEQVYLVAAGDSYYAISERFGLELDALHNYNGWPEGILHPLSVGEQVLIPPSDIATSTTLDSIEQQHVVVGGDSLTALADRYGVDVIALTNYNAWPDGLDHVIQPGDVVKIPPGGIGGATGTLPPVATAIVSVPESSAPIVIVTNPPCGDTLDFVVTVPCGSTPTPDDSVVVSVAANGQVSGAYRCTGPLGKDAAYQYYASCETAPVPASTVAGTWPAVSTTTTTTFPLTVPTSIAPGQDAVSPFEQRYTIVAGDNPSKVAALYGVTVEALAELNPEVSQTFLVGSVLRIPANARVPAVPALTVPPTNPPA